MKENFYTVLYMVLIAAGFTGVTSGVHLLNRERIERNREAMRARVVLRALGIEVRRGAGFEEIEQVYRQRVQDTGRTVTIREEEHPILEGLDEQGEPMGYAFEIVGRGVWDAIRGYLAISLELDLILGLAWHEQNETPGLGGEITREWFMAQFRDLPLPDEPGPDGRYVRLVPAGVEPGEHDADAITGATGTSDAVQEIINHALGRFMQAMAESD